MDDPGSPALIAQFPLEIMCVIFDYLDIDSVKMCSLVFRRWKEFIFSEYYIKRFRLSYRNRNDFYNLNQPLMLADRPYRHLKLWLEQDEFNTMAIVLRYPYLNQCISLELVLFAKEDLTKMTDAIERMGHLRELSITYRYWESVDYHIRSNSLQCLSCENTLPTFIDAPNVNKFVSKMRNHTQNDNPSGTKLLFSYPFPNLKHLEIDSNTSVHLESMTHAETFFAHHKGLETIILRTYVHEYMFTAICKNCPSLKKLHLQKILCVYESAINHLAKLTQLRDLTIEEIRSMEKISFLNVHLPQIKSLGIGDFPMQYETLEAFRTATKLKILHQNYSREFISTIASKMPLIREIEYISRVDLEFLERLPGVEVIVFNKRTLDYLLNTFEHPMSNIKEIYCMPISATPGEATIASLLKIFPNLRLLKCGDSLVYKAD